MKNQSLFSQKDKSKKLKRRLLQFLFGTLRVNILCFFDSSFNFYFFLIDVYTIMYVVNVLSTK